MSQKTPCYFWLALTLPLTGLIGCATSRPAAPDPDIEQLRASQKELQNSLTAMTAKLEGLETKLNSVNDKADAARAGLENLTVSRAPKAQPQAVQKHAADALPGGTSMDAEMAATDSDSGLTTGEAVEKYRKAMILFDSQTFSEAVLAFSGFVEQFPDHALAGSAQYYLGESYLRQKEYKLAIREFQRVLTSYDRSPHIADTLRELANAEEQAQQPALAAEHRQQLLSLFPHSPAAIGQKVNAVPPRQTPAEAAPAQVPADEPAEEPAVPVTAPAAQAPVANPAAPTQIPAPAVTNSAALDAPPPTAPLTETPEKR